MSGAPFTPPAGQRPSTAPAVPEIWEVLSSRFIAFLVPDDAAQKDEKRAVMEQLLKEDAVQRMA